MVLLAMSVTRCVWSMTIPCRIASTHAKEPFIHRRRRASHVADILLTACNPDTDGPSAPSRLGPAAQVLDSRAIQAVLPADLREGEQRTALPCEPPPLRTRHVSADIFTALRNCVGARATRLKEILSAFHISQTGATTVSGMGC